MDFSEPPVEDGADLDILFFYLFFVFFSLSRAPFSLFSFLFLSLLPDLSALLCFFLWLLLLSLSPSFSRASPPCLVSSGQKHTEIGMETSTDRQRYRTQPGRSWDREWTCSFLSVTTTLGPVPVRWYVGMRASGSPSCAGQCRQAADEDKQMGVELCRREQDKSKKITTV